MEADAAPPAPSPRRCVPHGRPAATCCRVPHGSRSTSRCRRCAWPAASRSMAKASARIAGRRLSFIERRPIAPGSAFPLSMIPAPSMLSMEAIANPPAYQRARAAVRYDDVARTLVHALKYQDRTDLAPAMGRWMARAGRELLDGADVLIPVPLHWRRGWSRRYNQSGALARVIARQTRRQGGGRSAAAGPADRSSRSACRGPQRASNVQGAFKVAADRAGRDPGPPRGPDRRCPDLGRDGGRLRAGAAARQGGPGRRAGVRPGCGHPQSSHIIGYFLHEPSAT